MTKPRNRACDCGFRTRNSTPNPCCDIHRTFANSISRSMSCPGNAILMCRYEPLSMGVPLKMAHPFQDKLHVVPLSSTRTRPLGSSLENESGQSIGMRGYFRELILSLSHVGWNILPWFADSSNGVAIPAGFIEQVDNDGTKLSYAKRLLQIPAGAIPHLLYARCPIQGSEH